jgi:hypothetical protein
MSFESDLEAVQKKFSPSQKPEYREEASSKEVKSMPEETKERNEEYQDSSKDEKLETEEETAPSGNMNLKEASEMIKKKLSDALGRKPESTISISKEGDVWVAEVGMIDEEYLPGKDLSSMNDIIGIYSVKMDSNGELINWSKKRSHQRGQP